MKPRLDAFGSFLETLHEPGGSRSERPSDAMWVILRILEDQQGEVPVADLLATTSVRLATVAEALSGLEEGGLVKMVQSESEERVRLTQAGQKVATVIKSIESP